MPTPTSTPARHSVLFVCLGNICRSPTAEGVFRHTVATRHLTTHFHIDSAGTGDWHIGAPPDPRAIRAAAAHNIDISQLRARQINAQDIKTFTHIIAMDLTNLTTLTALTPPQHRHKIHLLLDLTPNTPTREIPDPYYADDNAFHQTLTLIQHATTNLLNHIITNQ